MICPSSKCVKKSFSYSRSTSFTLYVDRTPIGQGKYLGRRENKGLQEKIEVLLNEGKSYTMIVSLLGCARGIIAKVSKRIKGKLASLSIS